MTIFYGRVGLKYEQEGLDAYNVFYVRNISPDPDPTFTVAEEVTDRVRQAFTAHVIDRMSEACALTEVKFTSLLDSGEHIRPVTTAQGEGNSTSGSLPINCAFLIRKRIEGSRRPGFMYLPGIPENAVNAGNTVGPSQAADTGVALNNFLLDLADPAFGGGVLPCEMVVPRANGSIALVESMECSTSMGVQNRRRT